MAGENIKRIYPIRGTATPGRAVQLLDTGEITNLPLRAIGPQYNSQKRLVSSSSGNTLYYPRALKVDDNRILYVWNQVSSTYYVYASVVTIDANENFVATTPVLITSGSGAAYAVQHMADMGNGKAALLLSTMLIILQVNADNTITVGTGVGISAGQGWGTHSIIAIDSNTVMAAYTGTNGNGIAQLFTVTGVTITAGTPITHSTSTATSYTALVQLDATRVFISYYDNNAYRFKVFTVNAAARTFTQGADFLKSTTGLGRCAATKTATDRVLVVITNSANSASAFLFKITGSTVSIVQDTTTFSTSVTFMHHDLITLAEQGKAVCAWQNGTNGATMYVTTISLGLDSFTVDTPNGTNVGAIESYQWVDLLLMDGANVDNQRYILIPAGGNAVMGKYGYRTGKLLGYLENAQGSVVLKGRVKGLSNLEVGRRYGADAQTGQINTVAGYKLGVAISDTELLIPDYLID
ncbi:hypothetical protein M655_009330 [Brevibacillus sp. NSP2.1]|uniref:hypothetical protein n=1 Tax=Brevibacillus sp. NSP2.1 TaxID=3003229 RepID=UPI0003F71374|nr:hypothetical protein [Brevibacillus sp. NSP2.1]QHZ55828.1 hypothetical protein M655_009330 [Brevibacillus sp. NSP2.1]